MFFREIPFEPPRAVITPRTRILMFGPPFVDIVQPFLNVGSQLHESVCNAFGNEPIAIKGAGFVRTVLELLANGSEHLRCHGCHTHSMLVGFSSLLSVPDKDHRRSEETGVPDEAAG